MVTNELIEYIRTELRRQRKEVDISADLALKGWSSGDIQQAYLIAGYKPDGWRRYLFILLLISFVFICLAVTVFALHRMATIHSHSQSQKTTNLAISSPKGWLEYFNSPYQMRLFYPPQFKQYGFGSLSTTEDHGKTGGEICVDLDGCIGKTTSEFELRSTSVGWTTEKASKFTELQGYKKINGKYYVILSDRSSLEIPPQLGEEYKSAQGISFLTIQGLSGDAINKAYPPAGYIGAVMDVNLPTYKAIVLQMRLTDTLNRDIFKQILESIQFPYLHDFPQDSMLIHEHKPLAYLDGIMKDQMKKVAEIVNCRYIIDKQYPASYYPDYTCGTFEPYVNLQTQKPYYYTTTDNGKGFILKSLLSTGKIYTITEKTNPPVEKQISDNVPLPSYLPPFVGPPITDSHILFGNTPSGTGVQIAYTCNNSQGSLLMEYYPINDARAESETVSYQLQASKTDPTLLYKQMHGTMTSEEVMVNNSPAYYYTIWPYDKEIGWETKDYTVTMRIYADCNPTIGKEDMIKIAESLK